MRPFGRFLLGVMLCTAGLSVSAHAGDVVTAEFRACPTGTAIGDVPSCGKIWKLKSGKGSVDANGTLKISLKGLVLNDESVGEFNGTPDGVGHVVGAVLCSGMVAAQTEWVALAKNGDVKVKAKLKLPASCIAPTLVVREVWEGKVGGWLAAAGY
jgi:hypothetical protein